VSLSHRFVIKVGHENLGVSSCEDGRTRGEAEEREKERHGEYDVDNYSVASISN
jgi:hypothetical protein